MKISINDVHYPLAILDLHFNYIAANQLYCQEFDLPPDFLGRNHYDFFAPHAKTIFPRHKRALEGQKVGPEEGAQTFPDGRTIWFRTRYSPIFDENNQLQYILVAAENITERKQMELALEASQKSLLHTNEELEQYLWILAHDLKTPIKNVVYLANDIVDRLPRDAHKTLAEPLHILNLNAEKIMERFEATLKHAAISQDYGTENVSIETLLYSIIATTTLVKNPLQYYYISLEQKEIAGVHFLYEVIFENLISNIWKYAFHANLHVFISLKIQDGFYVFQIQDNGPGVPEKYYKNIFLPFKKTPQTNEAAGSGIGLSLVEKAIRKMGGHIDILSQKRQKPQGLHLSFSIPIPLQARNSLGTPSCVPYPAVTKSSGA